MQISKYTFSHPKNHLYTNPINGLRGYGLSYRFQFNGQEKDDEVAGTGNTMTAEFWEYDVRLGRRFNLDPKYTQFESRYSVNGNNPIYYLDPRGDFKTWAGAFLWKIAHGGSGRINQDKKTGQYNVNRGGYKDNNGDFVVRPSVYGWKKEHKPIDYGGRNPLNPVDLGLEFFTGVGPKSRDFTDQDDFGKMWKKHSHIQDTRSYIEARLRNGLTNSGSFPYELKGLKGPAKFVYDWTLVIPTGGSIGNLAVAFTGGYVVDFCINYVDVENKFASVHFTVHNTSNVRSLTHPPLIGYTKIWDKYIGFPLENAIGETGPLSEKKQKLEWNENITY